MISILFGSVLRKNLGQSQRQSQTRRGDNADEESEGEAAKTYDKGDTELIRTEGKPGWVEKVLKKVWKYFAIRSSYENTQ